jgi:uncharacterized protein
LGDYIRPKTQGWNLLTKSQAVLSRTGQLFNHRIEPSCVPPEFRILSLSGGGYLGFYTALVLADLEKRAGKPIGQCFDLVAGTSIGGIVALAVAREVPMRDVVLAFEQRGDAIFPRRAAARSQFSQLMDVMRNLAGAKYDSSALRETVETFLPNDILMRDIQQRVAVSAVNLTRGMPHTFRSGYADCSTHSPNVKAVDVALATSAAPTLLPIHCVAGEYFSDGGIYANSPDQVALHEAEAVCNVDPERVCMLSIGTSSAAYHFPEPLTRSFGLKEWGEDQRIVKVALSSQQNHAMEIVRSRLGSRYLRIDEAQTPHESEFLGLDLANDEARRHLRAIASRTIRRLDGIDGLSDYLSHTAHSVPRNQLPEREAIITS